MGTPVSYDAWLTVYDSIRTLVQSLAPPIRQCSRFVVLRIDKICQNLSFEDIHVVVKNRFRVCGLTASLLLEM